MSRKARRKSSTGIYHIMLRGINRQTIFEDDEDKLRLLETIKKYKEISEFKLYSYCLMDNHIHLLIQKTEESVSHTIKRISASYVYWYNNKYERYGHLFQDRFKSENVETNAYFITVLRYIHQNPVKARLAPNIFLCNWTSLREYLGETDMVDIDFGLDLFSPVRRKALTVFRDYMQETNDDQCLDDHVKVSISDSEIRKYLGELGVPSSSSLQQMDRDRRDPIILELKRLNGVTLRQLGELPGYQRV